MRVVLDTSFLVDVRRGRPSAIALVERIANERVEVLVPTLVLVEFLGASREPSADLDSISEAGDVIEFGAADADAAISLARSQWETGRFPGWIDVMIAGTAIARGARVVTRNRAHFPAEFVLAYS